MLAPTPLSAPLFASILTPCMSCSCSAAAVAALGLAGAGTSVLAGARVARCLHKQLHHTPDVNKPSAAADAQAAAEQLSIEKLACHRNVPPPRAPVVLVSCGSFNPPTVMHLRMFDLATAALAEVGGAAQALTGSWRKATDEMHQHVTAAAAAAAVLLTSSPAVSAPACSVATMCGAAICPLLLTSMERRDLRLCSTAWRCAGWRQQAQAT